MKGFLLLYFLLLFLSNGKLAAQNSFSFTIDTLKYYAPDAKGKLAYMSQKEYKEKVRQKNFPLLNEIENLKLYLLEEERKKEKEKQK